jgi:hypothetical protein
MDMETHFHNVKTEVALPVFLAVLSSLLLCALLAINGTSYLKYNTPQEQDLVDVSKTIETKPDVLRAAHLFTRTTEEDQDVILELYREAETQNVVIVFFEGLCDSREIAEVILSNANAFDISPSLAFALSWEESRFNPLAVNNRNRDESIDRGLFQLNNRSFPRIEPQAFFNPKVNAWYGMGHLRHCLDTGGTEIAALAMYNAGTGRVKSSGTPKTTLDYIDRILENRRKIEMQFQMNVRQEAESLAAEKSRSIDQAGAPIEAAKLQFTLNEFSEKLAEAKSTRSRFTLLAPLAAAGKR